jgi:hypothetical protein
LERNNALLERELRNREDEICRLQEHTFKTLGDSRFAPMDEATVQRKLLKLRSGVARHARLYAAEAVDMDDPLFEESRQALVQEMAAVTPPSDVELDGLALLLAERPSIRICTTDLLSHAIHSRIMRNPFFFLRDDLDSRFRALPAEFSDLREREDLARELMKLYEDAQRDMQFSASLSRRL